MAAPALQEAQGALRGSDGCDTSALEEQHMSASSCGFQLGCKWIVLVRQSSVCTKSQPKPSVTLGEGKKTSQKLWVQRIEDTQQSACTSCWGCSDRML